MADTTASHKSLFDHLYDGAQEVLKGMQKPFVMRSLKRKFEAAYDQTLLRVDEAYAKLTKLREKIGDYPLQEVIEQREIIRQATNTQLAIETEFKELFGKDLQKRD